MAKMRRIIRSVIAALENIIYENNNRLRPSLSDIVREKVLKIKCFT